MRTRKNKDFNNKVTCLLVVCFAIMVPTLASAEKYAVVIGSGDYAYTKTVTQLPKAKQDARDMQEALRKIGWRGIISSDAPDLLTSEVTKVRITTILTNAKLKVKPEDDFLLFFAGHGVRDIELEGLVPNYYWLTHLVRLDSLNDRGILFGDFMFQVHEIRAKRKLILLDHCFGGQVVPVASSGPQSGRAAAESEFRLGEARSGVSNPIRGGKLLPQMGSGIVIIAADRDYAFESEKNGIFTSVLLEAFKSHVAAGKDGELKLIELTDYVDKAVSREATRLGLTQEPVIHGLVDDLYRWTIAVDLPKGNYEITGSELIALCKAWKKARLIDVLTHSNCRRAANYKIQRDGNPGFAVDTKNDMLYTEFAEHAVVVQENSDLTEFVLLSLCEVVYELSSKDSRKCK